VFGETLHRPEEGERELYRLGRSSEEQKKGITGGFNFLAVGVVPEQFSDTGEVFLDELHCRGLAECLLELQGTHDVGEE
jgi:hypothetical protein